MASGVRSDALRNRERLLEVAVRLFAERGSDVSPAMVAKEAGVGVGTLYRHFPTRNALVEAAYRADLHRLCESAPGLIAEHGGAGALRVWLGRCVDHAITKRGMADALRTVVTSDRDPSADSRDLLTAAVAELLAAGAADGTLREDLDPYDVLVGVTGVSLATGEYGDRKQANRLLDLMMDSYRRSAAR